MAVQINIVDLEQAQVVKKELDASILDLQAVITASDSTASDIEVLTRTVGLNEQAGAHLKEVAQLLGPIVSAMETVSAQLGNAIKSMEQFADSAARCELGRV